MVGQEQQQIPAISWRNQTNKKISQLNFLSILQNFKILKEKGFFRHWFFDCFFFIFFLFFLSSLIHKKSPPSSAAEETAFGILRQIGKFPKIASNLKRTKKRVEALLWKLVWLWQPSLSSDFSECCKKWWRFFANLRKRRTVLAPRERDLTVSHPKEPQRTSYAKHKHDFIQKILAKFTKHLSANVPKPSPLKESCFSLKVGLEFVKVDKFVCLVLTRLFCFRLGCFGIPGGELRNLMPARLKISRSCSWACFCCRKTSSVRAREENLLNKTKLQQRRRRQHFLQK